MAAPITPVKCYGFGNICIVCAFSFVSKLTDSDGNTKIVKHFDKKLKITPERLQVLQNVCKLGSNSDFSTETGICQKCFREMTKLLKTEKDAKDTRDRLNNSMKATMSRLSVCVPSPSKAIIKKREMKSPGCIGLVEKRSKPSASDMLVPIRVVNVVTLQPLHVLSMNQSTSSEDLTQKLSKSNKNQVTSAIPATSFVPIAPKPSVQVSKPAKRSLNTEFKPGKENQEKHIGEIEMIIHFPSGSKTRFITDEVQMQLCKVIYRNKDINQGLLNILVQSSPNTVVSSAAEVIQSESTNLAKRNSGSVLIDKTHKGVMEFTWDALYKELQIRAPNTLMVLSSITSSVPSLIEGNKLNSVLLSAAICLNARFREMTCVQYLIGLILFHGGCTHRDIARLSKVGLSVCPETVKRKLETWHCLLDSDLIQLRDKWAAGGACTKYQLIGDNWDKNIVPSYRTSVQKTQSIHLFNVIGVVDRISSCLDHNLDHNTESDDYILDVNDMDTTDFIPSIQDQALLEDELTFLIANSLIENIDQLNTLLRSSFPTHLEHKYSEHISEKTKQYSLGLFECDEKKTQDVIKLLNELSAKYVPCKDGEVVEEVFFGGDRLTDERIQVAQQSMSNSARAVDRLEGFISKIEDFHRLMNFLEAITRMTYNTKSGTDKGTVYYFRNKLDARGVSGDVKNSYRSYKMLFYTIFDGICCALFLKEIGLTDISTNIPLPCHWEQLDVEEKHKWLCDICRRIVKKSFFEEEDLFQEVRDVLSNQEHIENYWTGCFREEKFHCHYCNKSYTYIDTLVTHEETKHGYKPCNSKKKEENKKVDDELFNHVGLIFKLVALHKNMDTAVNMGDGYRSVRSAKYETPLYNKTGKTKYLIGSIHLTALVSGTLPRDQTERLIANRFINISGGKNNNIALDEYVEILNRETKNASTGFQSKEGIIKHSKDFPFLIESVKHYDDICGVRGQKGFHRLPSYKKDVQIVVSDLLAIKALEELPGRVLKCRDLCFHRNPYYASYKKLPLMIFRHKPSLPFRRLRNKRI